MHDLTGARMVAADAIEEAARRKNDPAGLINIALERLVEGSYKLPGNIFTKLAIGSQSGTALGAVDARPPGPQA